MRQQKRELNKTQRQLARDQTALERQEKQLVRQNDEPDICYRFGPPHHTKSLDHRVVIVQLNVYEAVTLWEITGGCPVEFGGLTGDGQEFV